MKIISVAIVAVALLLPSVASATVNVVDMIKIGEGRYWLPPPTVSRSVPALIKTSGAVVGSNWWRASVPWASIVVIAASFGVEYWINNYGDAAISNWLGGNNLRWDGVQGQAAAAAGEGYLIPNANAEASLVSWMAQHPEYSPYVVRWCSSYAAAAAFRGNHLGDAANFTYIRGSLASGAVGIESIERHNGHGGTCPWPDLGTNTVYVVYAYPISPGSVSAGTIWTNKTDAEMINLIRTAINNSTGTITDRAMWEKLEEALKDSLDKDRGTTSPGSDVNPANNKTAKQNAEDAAGAAINGQPTPDTSPEEKTTTYMGILEKIWKAITEGFTGLKSWIGFSDVPADVTNTGMDPNENATVLGEEGIETEVTAEQEKTTGILEGLWTATSALRIDIESKIGGMITPGSGVCSLNTSIWGVTLEFGVCDVDFSVFRTVIIAIGAIVAVMIVIM